MMKFQKTILPLSSLAGLACLIGFTSCTPLQQQGAQLGGLAGAAIGAVAGDNTNDIIRGAIVGAGVGASAAAVQEQGQSNSGYYNSGGDRYSGSNYGGNTYGGTTQAPIVNTPSYPLATKTGQSGYVKSPYRPYNTIDVRGIPSGKLAKEPGTDKIFVIP